MTVGVICACRCALAEWISIHPAAPKLSLSDSVTLSRNGRRFALAGRMMIYPTAPKLSLTDSVTLSRKRLRITLAGRTRYDGSAPHVSRNAATNDPESPMCSRGKDVCHPGGFDMWMMRYHDLTSDGIIRHNVKGLAPPTGSAASQQG